MSVIDGRTAVRTHPSMREAWRRARRYNLAALVTVALLFGGLAVKAAVQRQAALPAYETTR